MSSQPMSRMSYTRRQVRPSSSSSSSSSSYSSSQGFQDLNLTPNLGVDDTISPKCSCGIPSSLRIARTTNNPCRRFYNCNNCSFFMWLDPESLWYKHVVGVLLEKKSCLDMELEDSKLKLQVMSDNNATLQILLDEYLAQVDERGCQLQALQSTMEDMEKKIKKYKIVVLVFLLVLIIMLFK